jgi:hypothetical protein
MKPTQQPEADPPPARFVPSEEWTDAFDLECTELLLKQARRFAAHLAHVFGWDSPANDAYYADELVQNVVTDTLLGVLRWEPGPPGENRRPFAVHLYDAIRLRARRDAERAERLPHESMSVMGDDDEPRALAEVEAQLLADAPQATPETAARAAETAIELRKLARGKQLLLQLLDAFARDATSREDVMRVSNMSSLDYRNALRQLRRAVEQLPDHLKPRRRV